MSLVQKEDLKQARSSMSYLQRLATLPQQILDTNGDWSKIQPLLKTLFPVTGKCWIYTNIRKQDWSVLQTEKLNAVVKIDTVAVPKYRQLPDNYR